MGAGDRFIILDGQGASWLVVLHPEHEQAEVLASMPLGNELPLPVTLLMAMPKGNAMDDIVRQATEIGVTQIIPVQSDRTLLQPSPQKLDRWRRISREAAEQSERQMIPNIAEPLTWTALLTSHALERQTGYLCTARGDRPHLLQHLLHHWRHHPTPITIAIGPEGGWTEAEISQGTEAGYQVVSLGDRILRAATAPTVALGLVASVMTIHNPQP
jgi:16S rRNA (uracil1498-N3)-methyltransferase